MTTGSGGPVVICIADAPEERARLARLFDGAGILVLAPDTDSAGTFLHRLHDAGSARASADAPVSASGGASGRASGRASEDADVVTVGGLTVDMSHHEASWHGRPLSLTPFELKVLGCLAGHPGRVWTYRQLHDHAWEGRFTGTAAVQSVIKRLRAKLRLAGASMHIRATRGVGFRLDQGKELTLVRPAHHH